jgi:nicotinate-nucleotide pyrophosphorylase (carboxylating)
MPVEIEVRSLKEFQAALSVKPDILLLDNMTARQVRQAVRLRNAQGDPRRPLLEASGNITLRTIRAYAATGVTSISLGTLTKDLESFDFSLDWRAR